MIFVHGHSGLANQLLSKDFFCIQVRQIFSSGAKTQLGFRGTVHVNPKQFQGSIMKGTREQSPQDFYKFGDFKTMKLLFSGI